MDNITHSAGESSKAGMSRLNTQQKDQFFNISIRQKHETTGQ